MKECTEQITTAEMEIALATYFDYRRNLIVPNISWGLFLHECDLLILTKSGYAYEVEIKVSKADLIKDKEKEHGHKSNRIKFLYFAIPDYLLPHREHIPKRAGIISIITHGHSKGVCQIVRPPVVNSMYRFTDEERYQVARLGAIRIWGLKIKIQKGAT